MQGRPHPRHDGGGGKEVADLCVRPSTIGAGHPGDKAGVHGGIRYHCGGVVVAWSADAGVVGFVNGPNVVM